MMRFEYEGVDANNKHCAGVMEAKDFEDLLAQLLIRGIIPTRIQELSRAGYQIVNRIACLKKLKDTLDKPQIHQDIVQSTDVKQNINPDNHVKLQDWTYTIFIVITIIILILLAYVKL